ncbi:hypothetical protein CSB37_02705 [bacterium DOLZORAL124_38_8]|nr:MAG: hypothetical protein CSB37_02705 [bacterium DOLZORAL124_38_8]
MEVSKDTSFSHPEVLAPYKEIYDFLFTPDLCKEDIAHSLIDIRNAILKAVSEKKIKEFKFWYPETEEEIVRLAALDQFLLQPFKETNIYQFLLRQLLVANVD